MSPAAEQTVSVAFPLRGEGWVAVTSPAVRVPSHGTDRLGLRFAYDFLQRNGRGRIHPAGSLRSIATGVRTRDFFGWGSAIHAPFDAEVIAAVDGMPERARVHPVREAFLRYSNAALFTPARVGTLMGNHVLLRAGNLFAGFAHLAPGSVCVVAGQWVSTGDIIGRVGHTGNSTSPHLHFQVMDSANLLIARGIRCAFNAYEVETPDGWEAVTDGIPGADERIRSVQH